RRPRAGPGTARGRNQSVGFAAIRAWRDAPRGADHPAKKICPPPQPSSPGRAATFLIVHALHSVWERGTGPRSSRSSGDIRSRAPPHELEGGSRMACAAATFPRSTRRTTGGRIDRLRRYSSRRLLVHVDLIAVQVLERHARAVGLNLRLAL